MAVKQGRELELHAIRELQHEMYNRQWKCMKLAKRAKAEKLYGVLGYKVAQVKLFTKLIQFLRGLELDTLVITREEGGDR